MNHLVALKESMFSVVYIFSFISRLQSDHLLSAFHLLATDQLVHAQGFSDRTFYSLSY